SHPAWPFLMTQRAWLLGTRYFEPAPVGGDRADLDLAIAHAREAIRLGGSTSAPGDEQDSALVADRHYVLGLSLEARFRASRRDSGEPSWADGQEAVDELRLARAGRADPDDPEICSILGGLLADRCLRDWPVETGGSADRDEALSLLKTAAEAEEPDEVMLFWL